MSASIGWQQSKDDVADRSTPVPCHADFEREGGGQTSPFSFFMRIFPFLHATFHGPPVGTVVH